MSMTNLSEPAVPQPLPIARRRWPVLLLMLLIFASGLVIGGGGVLIVVHHRVVHALHHPELAPTRIAARLRSKLGLSDEQTRQAEEILRQRQKALQTIRREVQPRVVSELDQVESQIAAILDETQGAKWHAMFARLRETWIPPLPNEQ